MMEIKTFLESSRKLFRRHYLIKFIELFLVVLHSLSGRRVSPFRSVPIVSVVTTSVFLTQGRSGEREAKGKRGRG